MGTTLRQDIRLARGFCLRCSNKRQGHPELCEAHADLQAIEDEKARRAANWAGDLVFAAGGYTIDPAVRQRLLEACGGSISAQALDVVKLIAVMARDDGRHEVAREVRNHVNAHRVEGPDHAPEDTVKADELLEKIRDYL